jgi:hypothetical protein
MPYLADHSMNENYPTTKSDDFSHHTKEHASSYPTTHHTATTKTSSNHNNWNATLSYSGRESSDKKRDAQTAFSSSHSYPSVTQVPSWTSWSYPQYSEAASHHYYALQSQTLSAPAPPPMPPSSWYPYIYYRPTDPYMPVSTTATTPPSLAAAFAPPAPAHPSLPYYFPSYQDQDHHSSLNAYNTIEPRKYEEGNWDQSSGATHYSSTVNHSYGPYDCDTDDDNNNSNSNDIFTPLNSADNDHDTLPMGQRNSKLVYNLTDEDVLCGRGAPSQFHPGNHFFRQLVLEYQPSYVARKRAEKPEIALQLVERIKSRGGRFLKRTKRPGIGPCGHFCWIDIGDQRAYEKACQALREGAPDLRKKMAGDELWSAALYSSTAASQDTQTSMRSTTATTTSVKDNHFVSNLNHPEIATVTPESIKNTNEKIRSDIHDLKIDMDALKHQHDDRDAESSPYE